VTLSVPLLTRAIFAQKVWTLERGCVKYTPHSNFGDATRVQQTKNGSNDFAHRALSLVSLA
jgi:hypothetical protein